MRLDHVLLERFYTTLFSPRVKYGSSFICGTNIVEVPGKCSVVFVSADDRCPMLCFVCSFVSELVFHGQCNNSDDTWIDYECSRSVLCVFI